MERLWIAEGSTDSTRVNAESGRTSMRRSASARVASIPEGWQEHDQTRRERNGRRIYRNIRIQHGKLSETYIYFGDKGTKLRRLWPSICDNNS